MVMKDNKHVFWEALVVAVFIFGIGIMLGFFLEGSRVDLVSEMYVNSEIHLLDIQALTNSLDIDDLNCEAAINENINFGNRIYEDAMILDRYESAATLTKTLEDHHKRYDLLRTLFWINSIKIKEKCNESFHTVVYLYEYGSEEIEEKTKQNVFSRFLGELKEKKGDRIVLIPIAMNMNFSSLDVLIDKHQLDGAAIILDEDQVFTELEELDRLVDLT